MNDLKKWCLDRFGDHCPSHRDSTWYIQWTTPDNDSDVYYYFKRNTDAMWYMLVNG